MKHSRLASAHSVVLASAGWLLAGPVQAADCPFNHSRTNFPNLPCHDVAVGPGLAGLWDDGSGFAPTLDAAYTYEYMAASANVGWFHAPKRDLYVARAEFSYWLLATWGVGFGYAVGDGHGPLAHLFAGFPFGDNHYFIEPYYRLNFLVLDELDLVHECGLMAKITTYTI